MTKAAWNSSRPNVLGANKLYISTQNLEFYDFKIHAQILTSNLEAVVQRDGCLNLKNGSQFRVT